MRRTAPLITALCVANYPGHRQLRLVGQTRVASSNRLPLLSVPAWRHCSWREGLNEFRGSVLRITFRLGKVLINIKHGHTY